MSEEKIIGEYGDPSRLMESIREEADYAIRSMQEQTGKEIAQAEKDFDDEMRSFSDDRKRETGAEIERAIYIMKNRAAIEKRKLQLNAVEDFIQVMVKEAVEDYVKNNTEGYLAFLKKIIAEILPGVRGNDITVHLCPGDAALENTVRNFITRDNAWQGTVNPVIDKAITMGGLILENMKEGVLYNYSLERCINRSYDSIRKEVVSIVRKHIQPEQ